MGSRDSKLHAPGKVLLSQAFRDEHTRRRIAAAVAEAVCEVGTDRLTVKLVVARAQIARNTFYRLFDDVGDACRWAYEHAAVELAGPMEEARRSGGCWEERVEATIAALIGAVAASPSLAELYFVHSNPALLREAAGGPGAVPTLVRTLEEAPEEPRSRPAELEWMLADGVASVLRARLLRRGRGRLKHPDRLAVELTPLLLTPYRAESLSPA